MQTTPLRTATLAVVLCLAVGALSGVAAADPIDEATIGTDVNATVDGQGLEGGFTCAGTPTDHDCDKGGTFSAGPFSVDYRGFNGGSLDNESYALGDTFVVDAGNETLVAGFECEVGTDPEPGNPCPVELSDEAPDDGNETECDAGSEGDEKAGDDGDEDSDGDSKDDEGAGNDDGDENGEGDQDCEQRGEDGDGDDDGETRTSKG
jgi:hypothetical protein